jgi:hypothetical protein
MTPLPTPDGPRKATVIVLRPDDTLQVDAEPLMRLRASEGAQAAADRACHVREGLQLCLARIPSLYAGSAFADLATEARAIAALAGPVGLFDIVRVSQHLLDCLSRRDPVALGAVVARLLRLGERAVEMMGTPRPPH